MEHQDEMVMVRRENQVHQELEVEDQQDLREIVDLQDQPALKANQVPAGGGETTTMTKETTEGMTEVMKTFST